jgi:hypothetical protein
MDAAKDRRRPVFLFPLLTGAPFLRRPRQEPLRYPLGHSRRAEPFDLLSELLG